MPGFSRVLGIVQGSSRENSVKPDEIKWRLNWHPFEAEDGDRPEVDLASPKVVFLGRSTDLERPTPDPAVFLQTVCGLLETDMSIVSSRVRDR